MPSHYKGLAEPLVASVSRICKITNDHFIKFSDALYELGESCKLVLIDWNSLELIDLTDRNKIERVFPHLYKII